MRLLLFSNSTNAGEDYLSFVLPYIRKFTDGWQPKALFIPFAGISLGYEAYFELVKNKLLPLGMELDSLHQLTPGPKVLDPYNLIIVGGGNTFCLLKSLYDMGIMDQLREKIMDGGNYIGWSAGSNLACPTIKTTNDMPIVQPKSFAALNLLPFQINPHYTDFKLEGHAGETRDMRLQEFMLANTSATVVGLREGTLLVYENDTLLLYGSSPCKVFQFGKETFEISPGESLQGLLKN